MRRLSSAVRQPRHIEPTQRRHIPWPGSGTTQESPRAILQSARSPHPCCMQKPARNVPEKWGLHHDFVERGLEITREVAQQRDKIRRESRFWSLEAVADCLPGFVCPPDGAQERRVPEVRTGLIRRKTQRDIECGVCFLPGEATAVNSLRPPRCMRHKSLFRAMPALIASSAHPIVPAVGRRRRRSRRTSRR